MNDAGQDERATGMMIQEWKVDSEGVYLCPECWQGSDEYKRWLSTDVGPDDQEYCESCSRLPDGSMLPTGKRLAEARHHLKWLAAPDSEELAALDAVISMARRLGQWEGWHGDSNEPL